MNDNCIKQDELKEQKWSPAALPWQLKGMAYV